jgi:hypothetical protein
MHAQALAARISGIELDPFPWPHAVLDDFLPQCVFQELLDALPTLKWDRRDANGGKSKATKLPKDLKDLLHDETVLDAIRERFGFQKGKVMLEVAHFAQAGIAPHVDRKDKLWNGQVYLCGESKGTELYDAKGNLAKVVEWVPNRFTCWPPPKNDLKHAAPRSSGRFLLLWWILQK